MTGSLTNSNRNSATLTLEQTAFLVSFDTLRKFITLNFMNKLDFQTLYHEGH